MATKSAAMAALEQKRAESSARTQQQLLEATYASLLDIGYVATSTAEVCKRSGTSRGAMLHHYPTRAHLVAAAAEFVMMRRLQEFAEAFGALPPKQRTVDRGLDLLWEFHSGPSFYVWLELNVAARTDPKLKEQMLEVMSRFSSSVRNTYQVFFPDLVLPPEFQPVAMDFTLALMDGMGVDLILSDEASEQRVLTAFKALVGMLMKQGQLRR